MRIQLARNVFVSGEPRSTGDVIDVDDVVGRELLLLHRGSLVVDAPAAEVATIEAPEHADVRPQAARRKG